MQDAYWEHFEHPADVGIRGVGRTVGQAFEQAALALSAVTVDIETVEPRQAVTVACEGQGDPDLLLAAWLNTVIYEAATRSMVFGRFAVTIGDNGLSATLWGEPLDRRRHAPGPEVKAATYAQLRVEQRPDGAWLAQCIVDV